MSVIEEIKSRLDIVDIIGASVQLRKTGKTYLGFCPFHHNTRTPAFTVYPDSQSFYCFGCQASGTVFDFVMRQNGLEFRDALQLLAQKAGVTLHERTPEEQQQDQQHTRLLDITTTAARYFNYLLLQHPRGQPGRDYLDQRGITIATREAFHLGYSFDQWQALLNYLTQRKGYTPEEIEMTGLAIPRQQGGHYDRFRGRLIFPIYNHKNTIVGFGGRAIGDAQPKYMNTPQTPLFDKSRVLYGLSQARDSIRTSDAVIIVEGYLDVLTAHQHGFPNVVAPLGTALTPNHVNLLQKLTRNISLALDADSAGQKATLRGITTLQQTPDPDNPDAQPTITAQGLIRWQSNLNLTIIKMPPGQDPDDVIKSNPDQWRSLVANAMPVVDFYIDAYTAGLDLSHPQEQRTALERLVPLIAQLDPTQQRIYTVRLEQLTSIKADFILDMLNTNQSPAPTPAPRPAPSAGPTIDPYLIERGYRPPPKAPHEDHLLALILRYPNTRALIEQTIQHDLEPFPSLHHLIGPDITHLLEQTHNRLILDAWNAADAPALTPDPTVPPWARTLDPPLQSHLTYLATLKLPNPTEYRYTQEAPASARHLRRKQARNLLNRLSQQARNIQDTTEQRTIETQMLALSRYLNAVNTPPPSKSFLDLRTTLEKE